MTRKLADIMDEDMRVNLRYMRARHLVVFVMDIVAPHLGHDNSVRRRVHDELFRLFHDSGYEVLSDEHRSLAGLPRRDEKGWTPPELLALEQARIAAMMRPLPYMPELPQWQPIATAPLIGKPVLLYEGGHMALGQFWVGVRRPGWYMGGNNPESDWPEPDNPTHWMYPPKPPVEEEEKNG